MKKLFLILIAITMGLLASVAIYDYCWPAGSFISISGQGGRVTVTYNSAGIDSTWVIFHAPVSGTAYDSIKCMSIYASTRFLEGTGLSLDSIGSHRFIAKGFSGDAWTDTITGTWLNVGAAMAGAGSGAQTYPCTLYVANSADSTAVEGAVVTVRPLGGGNILANGASDANGIFIYSSDAESISIYLLSQGWDFNAEDTLTIAGAQTDTLYGTAFSPSAPADMTGIFCWLLTPGGDTIDPSYVRYRPVPAADSVYTLYDWITVGTGANKILLNKNFVTVESDTSLISFNLYPNSSIYINGTADTSSIYEFEAEFLGNRTRVYIAVPDTTQFNPFAQ